MSFKMTKITLYIFSLPFLNVLILHQRPQHAAKKKQTQIFLSSYATQSCARSELHWSSTLGRLQFYLQRQWYAHTYLMCLSYIRLIVPLLGFSKVWQPSALLNRGSCPVLSKPTCPEIDSPVPSSGHSICRQPYLPSGACTHMRISAVYIGFNCIYSSSTQSDN